MAQAKKQTNDESKESKQQAKPQELKATSAKLEHAYQRIFIHWRLAMQNLATTPMDVNVRAFYDWLTKFRKDMLYAPNIPVKQRLDTIAAKIAELSSEKFYSSLKDITLVSSDGKTTNIAEFEKYIKQQLSSLPAGTPKEKTKDEDKIQRDDTVDEIYKNLTACFADPKGEDNIYIEYIYDLDREQGDPRQKIAAKIAALINPRLKFYDQQLHVDVDYLLQRDAKAAAIYQNLSASFMPFANLAGQLINTNEQQKLEDEFINKLSAKANELLHAGSEDTYASISKQYQEIVAAETAILLKNLQAMIAKKSAAINGLVVAKKFPLNLQQVILNYLQRVTDAQLADIQAHITRTTAAIQKDFNTRIAKIVAVEEARHKVLQQISPDVQVKIFNYMDKCLSSFQIARVDEQLTSEQIYLDSVKSKDVEQQIGALLATLFNPALLDINRDLLLVVSEEAKLYEYYQRNAKKVAQYRPLYEQMKELHFFWEQQIQKIKSDITTVQANSAKQLYDSWQQADSILHSSTYPARTTEEIRDVLGKHQAENYLKRLALFSQELRSSLQQKFDDLDAALSTVIIKDSLLSKRAKQITIARFKQISYDKRVILARQLQQWQNSIQQEVQQKVSSTSEQEAKEKLQLLDSIRDKMLATSNIADIVKEQSVQLKSEETLALFKAWLLEQISSNILNEDTLIDKAGEWISNNGLTYFVKVMMARLKQVVSEIPTERDRVWIKAKVTETDDLQDIRQAMERAAADIFDSTYKPLVKKTLAEELAKREKTRPTPSLVAVSSAAETTSKIKH